MKIDFKSTAFALGLAAILFCSSNANAQNRQEQSTEIEIIDQEGKAVDGNKLRLFSGGNGGVQIFGNGSGGIQIQGAGQGQAGGIGVQAGDGKIVVIDENGNKQEIDVSGAKSIIVNQGLRSIMVDGEQQQESFGKAIVIGPDGVRQEFQLAPNANGQPGNAQPRWHQFQAQPVQDSYRIGVYCDPMNEALSSQLDIEPGTGLLVNDVMEDAPASTAGLQKFDILMFAEDTALKSNEDLTKLVDEAGKKEKALSITILRKGKEKTVEVTPEKRPVSDLRVMGGLGQGGPIQMQFRQLGPGALIDPPIMIDQNIHQQMRKEMELMRKEMESFRQKMKWNELPLKKKNNNGGGEDF